MSWLVEIAMERDSGQKVKAPGSQQLQLRILFLYVVSNLV